MNEIGVKPFVGALRCILFSSEKGHTHAPIWGGVLLLVSAVVAFTASLQ